MALHRHHSGEVVGAAGQRMTDRQLAIATGRLKQENNRHWTNQKVTWSQVCGWGDAKATAKTNAMSYVAGELAKSTTAHAVYENGKRTGASTDCTEIHRGIETVVKRSFITLDADYLAAEGDPAGDEFRKRVESIGWEASVQASWSHKPDAARLRLLVLPSRDMTPDEYRKVARWCMIEIGISVFDQGCDQPERFMFMPTATAERWQYAGVPVDVDAACLDIDMMPIEEKKSSSMSVSYSGPPYASLSPEKQAWAARQVQVVSERSRVNLEVAAAWDEGVVDDRGRGWERLMRDWAWELARLTLAPWTALTEDDGEMLFESVTPAEMLALWPDKWDRALANAADEAVDQPPWAGFSDLIEESGFQPVAGGRVSATLATGRRPIAGSTELLAPDDSSWTANSETILTGKGWTDGAGCRYLRHWRGRFYEWAETYWKPLGNTEVEAVVGDVLATAYHIVESKKGVERRAWPDSPKMVGEMVSKIRSRSLLHSDLRAGTWFDCTDDTCPVGDSRDERWIAFKNGILSMKTRTLLPNSAGFFNTEARMFDYDPHALCPLWEQTLKQWYSDDDMARHSEEVLGYLVFGEMAFDKAFPFLGPLRSGKGTIMRLVNSMLSEGAYKAVEMDTLGDRFGPENLIGVLVAHVSEAVSTRETKRVTSLIKSISGQDVGQNVLRKGRESVVVDHTVRFVFTGNHSLELEDSSGVIADRMAPVVQDSSASFYGREDGTLTARLIEERPGIAARLLVAYDRLVERGRFLLPAASQAEVERMRSSAAPFVAWFNTVLEPGVGEVVPVEVLLDLWQAENGTRGRVIYNTKWMVSQLRERGAEVRRVGRAEKREQSLVGYRLVVEGI